ncbi:MarR family winged helix-turn-helix transcriptional regulator [Enterovibrio sp. ZSDZ35]|uniref:MarR family winged helix-turn-helix transcriptional regulator n=1 Tax=Enterovibrio qingdaonensis TaxID=2899818 RepID=A0ABT5QRA4_9GAMM|nr:MarR family winged helix-turn-helix transcriptional regulator [Enterovibrio sp. ZSDZ35]MDD1783119.1 MarR family winged helix-turn-helix transcriptional regulator [Enterovibrio sp. ZSDZ35]
MGLNHREQLCFNLYTTSSLITQAYQPLLRPLSLTYPQFAVMMSLWQKQDVSITELAHSVGLSKATVTPIVKRLQHVGYVTKSFAEGNERQKSVALTEEGQKLARKGKKAAKQALCATGLTEEEAKLLIDLSQKIQFNLSK